MMEEDHGAKRSNALDQAVAVLRALIPEVVTAFANAASYWLIPPREHGRAVRLAPIRMHTRAHQ